MATSPDVCSGVTCITQPSLVSYVLINKSSWNTSYTVVYLSKNNKFVVVYYLFDV